MSESRVSPRVTLRIPGEWSHPLQLIERLPTDVQLEPERLVMPDGTEFEFAPLPADDQFAEIFEASCRRPPKEEEMKILARYRVIVALSGPAGSMNAARAMMRAGAAFVKAGAAGVFIDNSALAHGGTDWVGMTNDGSPDAVSFAFASIIRGRHEIYTMGMQVMGLPDLLMRSADVDDEGTTIIEIIRYVCAGEKPIDVGHVLADLDGPRFHVVAKTDDEFEPENDMHNPYGRLKLVNSHDLAEGN